MPVAKKKPAATAGEVKVPKPKFQSFSIWIVGDTPLICHAWAPKNKKHMLEKQQKKVNEAGKDIRDPDSDFLSSLYEMGEGAYGFPLTAVKKCMLSAAHKDKGVPRDTVMRSLWLDGQMVRVQPAHAGAICDLPLLRIHGSRPEMREDAVNIGSGLKKTASLAYRAQFTVWAMKVNGRFNTAVLTPEWIAFLVESSGLATGIGNWRNEKNGVFGAFHLASAAEEAAWDAFAAGKGPLPLPAHMAEAA